MNKEISKELSENRREVRQSYDSWKRLEKGSPSNISGVNPTEEQSIRVKEQLQTEQFHLENLNQSVKNLTKIIGGILSQRRKSNNFTVKHD